MKNNYYGILKQLLLQAVLILIRGLLWSGSAQFTLKWHIYIPHAMG